MELRHLRSFVLVAKTTPFSVAAFTRPVVLGSKEL